jgi:hypothetical protein
MHKKRGAREMSTDFRFPSVTVICSPLYFLVLGAGTRLLQRELWFLGCFTSFCPVQLPATHSPPRPSLR